MARRTKTEVAADRALVARILASLDTSVAAVERAMVLLYERQTAVEQATETTTEHNAIGFSANDATVGTRIVKNVILRAKLSGVPAGRRLWGGSLAISRRIARRYASTQLLDAARAKRAAELSARGDEEEGRLAHPRPLDVPAPAPESHEPPVGSWAAVARMMAAGDGSGFDWDAWKDEMKEAS